MFGGRSSKLVLVVKNPPTNAGDIGEMQVWSLGQQDPLEEGMATHSSILAWRIPWTEESDGLQPIESQRVGQVGTHAYIYVCVCVCVCVCVYLYMFPKCSLTKTGILPPYVRMSV